MSSPRVITLDDILSEGPAEAGAWKSLNTLAFDATSVDESELIPMTLRLLVMHDLAGKFGITSQLWLNFMNKIKSLMHPNPYHNFQHICDVAQTTSVILLDPLCGSQLDDFDKFTLIIGALLHDVDHPGKNNNYQINAGTELAILYNDISVLENHHASTSTKILQETGMWDHLVSEDTDKKKARTRLIEFILATDMAKHFGIAGELNKFNETTDRPDAVPAGDRLLMMKCILHMADISNPAKDWEVSKMWSDRVTAEFLAQGDIEKNEALPVSPMCDRETTYQDESSLGFCDFIVAPYLFSVTKLAPTILIPACKVLGSNRDKWHDMLAERLNNDEEKMKPWIAKKDAFKAKLETLLGQF